MEEVRALVETIPDFPMNFEVNLDLFVDDDGDMIGPFYFVNMETKEVFWPVDVPSSQYTEANIKIINSREHIRQCFSHHCGVVGCSPNAKADAVLYSRRLGCRSGLLVRWPDPGSQRNVLRFAQVPCLYVPARSHIDRSGPSRVTRKAPLGLLR